MKKHPRIYLLVAAFAALSGCASNNYVTSIEPGSDWTVEQICGYEGCGGGPMGALFLQLEGYRVEVLPDVSHDPATGRLWRSEDVYLYAYPNPSGSIQFVPAFSLSSLDGTKYPFKVLNCGATPGNESGDTQTGPQAFTGEYPKHSQLCYTLLLDAAALPVDQVFKLEVGAIISGGKTMTIPTVTLNPPAP